MTFPTTPVLDSFTSGASQALSTRAGWSTSHTGGYGDFVTDSVPTKAVAPSNADNIWGTNYANCEVYATIVDWPGPIAGSFVLVGRQTGGNYYWLHVYSGGWNVQRVDAGVPAVNLAGSTPLSPAVGDSIGLSCVGSTISGYYKVGAGAWTLLGSGTDTLYSTAAGIGILVDNTGNSFTNFGGGAVTESGPRQQTVPFTRGAGGGGKI